MTEKRRASQSNVTQSTASDFKPLKAKRETEHGDARQNKTEAGIQGKAQQCKTGYGNAGPGEAARGKARQGNEERGRALRRASNDARHSTHSKVAQRKAKRGKAQHAQHSKAK